MQMDRLRIGRAGAAVLAAVVMSTTFALQAEAYGGQGEIRLQLGGANPVTTPGTLGQWVYKNSSGDVVASEWISYAPNNNAAAKNCQYASDQTFGSDVAQVRATRTTDPSSPTVAYGVFDNAGIPKTYTGPVLGIGATSLGVYNNANGTSCSRMSVLTSPGVPDVQEGIEFKFGSQVTAQFFDRVAIDFEAKGDAKFVLTVMFDANGDSPGLGSTGYEHIYKLYSGSQIIPEAHSGVSTLAQPHFRCSPRSDSGPDSASNDNCRWIIDDIGNRFTLKAEAGEGSWQGGGDYIDDPLTPVNEAVAANTVIYLASLEETGVLTCDRTGKIVNGAPVTSDADNLTGTVGGGATASCQITRIAPNDLGFGEVCLKEFPYRLATEVGDSACTLDQQTSSDTDTLDWNQQLNALVKLTFPEEARTDIVPPTDDGGFLDLSGLPQRTSVQFSYFRETPSDSELPRCTRLATGGYSCLTPPDFFPERCEGTVVLDDNENPTILEVFQWPADSTVDDAWKHQIYDVVVSDGTSSGAPLDWACILRSEIEYVGGDMQRRTDTVLFWGDARMASQ